MISITLMLISILTSSFGKHFNGGTIDWAPTDPYTNSTPVNITITQSYSWTYPYVSCANDVPISTPRLAKGNTTLICVVDCSTDGGYSSQPIDILTDCTSASSSLGMMTSEKSKTVSLAADAHFYLAYTGSAWINLNDPPEKNLEWSIVTYIDLRKRPDGFINTPPVAKVISPQYAFVNKTVQIQIPVSDANPGDDVRCRWSTYTTGYRRRKRFHFENLKYHKSGDSYYADMHDDQAMIRARKNRAACGSCSASDGCPYSCSCSCPGCANGAACPGMCDSTGICVATTTITIATTKTTTATTTTTTATTITTATTTVATTITINTTIAATTNTALLTTTPNLGNTTTIETVGTPRSTSTFPVRQAINECGDICHPGGLPNSTTLSGCTISFTGLKAGVWYAVALQVEDFINSASTTPMSSVPVQFLIYVQPTPACSLEPLILPLTVCLEVQVGVQITFNLSIMNLCNSSVATIADIFISNGIVGMTRGNLTKLASNASMYYVQFSWTPQINQVGSQQLCVIASTTEHVQSNESCVTFVVKNSSDLCITTEETTSIATTAETTSIATTAETTSITTATTETTSITTTVTTTSTTKNASGPSINWLLILGLSLLGLLMLICCCCCLYRLFCAPAARRRRRKNKNEQDTEEYLQPKRILRQLQAKLCKKRTTKLNSIVQDVPINNSANGRGAGSTMPHSDFRIRLSDPNYSESATMMTNINEHRISSTITVKRIPRDNVRSGPKFDRLYETENTTLTSLSECDKDENSTNQQSSRVTVMRVPNSNRTTKTDESGVSRAVSIIRVSSKKTHPLADAESSKRNESRTPTHNSENNDVTSDIQSSRVQVVRIPRNVTKVEKSNETEKLKSELPSKTVYDDKDTTKDNGQRVTIVRIPKPKESNKTIMNPSQDNNADATLSTRSPTFDQVKVTRITRSSSVSNQHTHAPRARSRSYNNLGRHSLKSGPPNQPSRACSVAENVKSVKGKSVSVIKLKKDAF